MEILGGFVIGARLDMYFEIFLFENGFAKGRRVLLLTIGSGASFRD